MKKRNVLIIILAIILLLIGLIIAIVAFNKQKKYNIQEDFIMPEDLDFTDNELLYGNWNSKTLQIYNNGELKLSIEDVDDKMINFYSGNLIGICYLRDDEYTCIDSDYAFIDNKLYIPIDTYLSKKSEVILNGDSLILKYAHNEDDYSLLYFERE